MFRSLLALAIFANLTACFNTPIGSTGSTSRDSTGSTDVSTTKSITQVDAGSTTALRVGVSDTNALKGTSVTLPPGSLNISTSIVIEQGADFANSNIASEVQLVGNVSVTGAGNGVIVRPSENAVLNKPLTISLPLPTSAGLRLGAAAPAYAVYYKYLDPATNQLVAGLKIVDGVSTKFAYDTTAKQDTIQLDGYFGIYWVVTLSREVLAAEVAPPVVSEVAIVNKANTQVMTTAGVVKESTIIATQSIPELVWPKPVLTYDSTTRSVQLSAKPTFAVTGCSATLFESLTDLTGISLATGVVTQATVKLQKLTAFTLVGRFRCFDSQSRLSISGWSDPVSIEAVPTGVAALAPTLAPLPDRGVINTSFTVAANSTNASSFLWSQVEGPSSLFFTASAASTTNISATVDGHYKVQVTATSPDGQTTTQSFGFIWDHTGPDFTGINALVSQPNETEAWIYWTPAHDNVFAPSDVFYEICQSAIVGTCLTNFTVTFTVGPMIWDKKITGMTAGTVYEYAVRAYDKLGNKSPIVKVLTTNKLGNVQYVRSGLHHSCAVMNDGTLKCWGENAYGQLGDGTRLARSSPVTVAIAPVADVALGDRHTCARLLSGSVNCWGSGTHGALGDGTAVDRLSPTTITTADIVVDLAAGNEFTCAVVGTAARQVYCWGLNDKGQLGVTAAASVLSPQILSGVSSVQKIAAGAGHACAIGSSSTRCWGANTQGELGLGTFTSYTGPQIITSTLFTDIAIGGAHTCGVSSGAVKCWGFNSEGQIGDGTLGIRAVPTVITGLTGVTSIAAGPTHTCVITSINEVKCWGQNVNGTIGNLSTLRNLSPTVIPGFFGATPSQVSAGEQASCVVVGPGVKCWGTNSIGQLGIGAANRRPTPVAINPVDTTAKGFKYIKSGAFHACGLMMNGTVECWGRSEYGQLGNNSLVASPTPQIVTGLTQVKQLASGQYHACALSDLDGSVRCWGRDEGGQAGVDPVIQSQMVPIQVGANLGPAAFVATGFNHSCAIFGGAVWCWGVNDYGQLGNGTTSTTAIPVQVIGISNATALSLGTLFGCAIYDADGKVKCWGNNTSGQLGDGTTISRFTASVASPVLVGAVSISSGYDHTCAVLLDSSVSCWGLGNEMRLGNGQTSNQTAPVKVSGITNARNIALGSSFSCATLADGIVSCWGNNASEQLGTLEQPGPLTALNLGWMGLTPSDRFVSAGNEVTCIPLADGTARCLGSPVGGVLSPAYPGYVSYPVSVLAGSN
ncbi:MAG: hypothetical protein H7249_00115 [Chitinophagaceae bacterium]|nr:hypothetical protein [Oligoflexus sp.]